MHTVKHGAEPINAIILSKNRETITIKFESALWMFGEAIFLDSHGWYLAQHEAAENFDSDRQLLNRYF